MSGSIVVSNYTDSPIEVSTIPDKAAEDSKSSDIFVHTIRPKDSYVFFLSRVDSLHWEKKK